MAEQDFQDTLRRATTERGAAGGAGRPGSSVDDIVASDAGVTGVIAARPRYPPMGRIPYPVYDEADYYIPIENPT
eukprot:4738308-Prorocentrum_lima.AAC.1